MKVQRSAERRFRQLRSGKTGEQYSLSAVLSEATGSLFVHQEILEPGRRSSAPHRHSQGEEMVYMLKGEAIAVEANEEILLKAGDTACFDPSLEQLHWIENRSPEPAEFLVIRPRHAHDTHF